MLNINDTDKATNRVIPKKSLVQLGENAVFTCLSWFPVQWRFEGGKLPFNAKPDDQPGFYALDIIKTDYFNEGLYTCHGKYGRPTENSGKYFDNDAVLYIRGKLITTPYTPFVVN